MSRYPDPIHQVLTDADLFDAAVGQVRPPISSFANIVFPSGPSAIGRLLSLDSRIRVGVWGEAPPFLRYNEPNTLPWDNAVYIRLWGESVNQQWLKQKGGAAKLGMFTMVVDCTTTEEVIRYFDSQLEEDATPTLDNMWPLVAAKIDALRWVYIPLSDEYPLALFVASTEHANVVDRLRHSLTEDGIAWTLIGEIGGRMGWRLPTPLRRACGIH